MYLKKNQKSTGITGKGENYSSYTLSVKEIVLSITAGFCITFAGMYIIYRSVVVSVLLGIAGGVCAIYVGRKILKRRLEKRILLQFRSMLDGFFAAFSSGCNFRNAINDTYGTLKFIYGENAVMVRELKIMSDGLANGYTAEELLDDWQRRLCCDSITVFAETFIVSMRTGGNLGRAASDCRAILSEKTETEMEIRASVASGRNELNILAAMPFAITAVLDFLYGGTFAQGGILNVCVKTGAIIIFALAYIIGRHITDIKV